MRTWAPVATGVALTLALVWTGRPPEAGTGWRLAFVAFHLGAFGGLVGWLRVATPSAGVVVIGAALFRLLALPMLPSLSDDGYRYLWDGRVAVEAGESPYSYRPADSALRALRPGEEYRRMNSRSHYSVYPPVSQGVFAAAVAIGGSGDWRVGWWVLKLLMVLAEGVAIFLLIRASGPRAAALYAWSPLAVIEVAGQGHTEALVLLGLGLALYTGWRRWPAASVGLALAGGVKLYPFLWLPQAWRRDGWRGIAASTVLVGMLLLPLSAPGALGHVRESLALFFGVFDEYAAPYLVLKSALYPWMGEAAGAAASRALAIAFLLGVVGLAVVDDGTPAAWKRTLTWGVVGFGLTASTLHPWYWLPALYVAADRDHVDPLLWLIVWSTAAYAGYVVEPLGDIATVVGWGGAGVLLWARLSRSTPSPLRPGPS